MKKKIIFILFIAAATIQAQSAGNSGMSFLKLGFGSRNVAMGDIGAASANDISALQYNPALLAKSNSYELIFMHNEWIQDVRSEYLGAGFKLWGIPFAAGFNYSGVSDIEARTLPGEAQSTFSADYFAATLSSGFYVAENLGIGLSIKYLYEGIFAYDAAGYAFDFGAFYDLTAYNITLGAAVKNLGSMNELRYESTKLPAELRGGAVYKMRLESINSYLTVGSDIVKYLENDDMYYHFGGELFFNDVIAARVGYQAGWESRGLTAGAGLKWGALHFDYALVPFNYDLGTGHTISLKYVF